VVLILLTLSGVRGIHRLGQVPQLGQGPAVARSDGFQIHAVPQLRVLLLAIFLLCLILFALAAFLYLVSISGNCLNNSSI